MNVQPNVFLVQEQAVLPDCQALQLVDQNLVNAWLKNENILVKQFFKISLN